MKWMRYLSGKTLLLLVFGSLLFSCALNWFIVPAGLFNGGFLGIAQLLQYLLKEVLRLPLPDIDWAGILYYLINLPLLYLSYRLDRGFFIKTMICVPCYTLFLTIVPIPDAPVFADRLTACLVGGLLAGVGAGMTLLSGGSGGGEEILGVYFTVRNPKYSVGKLLLILNVLVYTACLLMTDFETVVYSIIYSAVTAVALDRVHLQSIMRSCLIITKQPDMERLIFETVHRGVTTWNGYGGYTKEQANILLTVVTKKESLLLKKAVLQKDPTAFILTHEDIMIEGNFQKRL